MRSSRRFLLFLLAPTLLAAQVSSLGSGRKVIEAKSVVRSFLEQDYRGGRLSPEPLKKLLTLTTWKTDPEWQAITVISHYDITSGKTEGLHRANIGVTYYVTGRYLLGVGYTAETEQQDAVFLVGENEDTWKLEEMDPPLSPHVSRAALVQWLKNNLPKEQDAMRKAAIQNAIKQLDTPAPPAASR